MTGILTNQPEFLNEIAEEMRLFIACEEIERLDCLPIMDEGDIVLKLFLRTQEGCACLIMNTAHRCVMKRLWLKSVTGNAALKLRHSAQCGECLNHMFLGDPSQEYDPLGL